MSPTWSLTANAYVRRYIQHTVDGNPTNAQPCDDPTLLCFNDTSTPANGLNGQQLANPFPSNAALGEIDRSTILTTSVGSQRAAVQQRHPVRLQEPRHLRRELRLTARPITAPPPNWASSRRIMSSSAREPISAPRAIRSAIGPVNVNSINRYLGLYALDALDLTDKLTLSAGARFNLASISLFRPARRRRQRQRPIYPRQSGRRPDLQDHAGPAGLWLLCSESNRAPTPLELGCANPQQPCIIGSFLVSDPPLQQVVAQTFEAGFRGQHVLANDWGAVGWKAGVYRTLSTNDILNVPSPTQQGFGYFANVGDTLRQGVEAQLNYRKGPFTVRATYAYIDATFRNYLTLASNSPSADANGNIFVVPGDQLPLIPRQRGKVSLDWDINSKTRIGADILITGPQRYAGDASNQQPMLPGYATVSLNGAYKVTHNFEVFASANNLFDHRYYTYGGYFDTSQLFQAFTNPESVVPAQPLSVYGGIRYTF